MKSIKLLFTFCISILATNLATAEERLATLNVEGMTCASCPYQVEKALTDVEGVKNAFVAIKTREAEVTYDDTQTDVAALTEATSNAGFPSTLKEVN